MQINDQIPIYRLVVFHRRADLLCTSVPVAVCIPSQHKAVRSPQSCPCGSYNQVLLSVMVFPNLIKGRWGNLLIST